MAAKPKSLNDRMQEASETIASVQDALNSAASANEDCRKATRVLVKSIDRLRKLLEDVGEIFDEVTDALGSLESALEEQTDLGLEKHVESLEDAGVTVDEVNELELDDSPSDEAR
jgi:ABC-type transporter Mla subunit MlaD